MTSNTVIGNAGDEWWARVMLKARHVANKVAREFPGIESEDIEQEIFVYAAKNRASIERTTTTASGLESVLLKAARSYAGKERYQFIHMSAEWIYTPKEVQALFAEAYFDKGMWQNMPQKEEGVSITAKNVVVSLWDIDRVFDTLSPAEQAVLISRFDRREEYADDTARKFCNRTVDKVTQRLNGSLAAAHQTSTVNAETL